MINKVKKMREEIDGCESCCCGTSNNSTQPIIPYSIKDSAEEHYIPGVSRLYTLYNVESTPASAKRNFNIKIKFKKIIGSERFNRIDSTRSNESVITSSNTLSNNKRSCNCSRTCYNYPDKNWMNDSAAW